MLTALLINTLLGCFPGTEFIWLVLAGIVSSYFFPDLIGAFLWSPYPRLKWFLISIALPFLVSSLWTALRLSFGDEPPIQGAAQGLFLWDLLLLSVLARLKAPVRRAAFIALCLAGWGIWHIWNIEKLHPIYLQVTHLPELLPILLTGLVVLSGLLWRAFRRLTLETIL
jgi:hypothetical protein